MQRFASVVLVDPRGWVLLQERDEFPAIDPEKWGFVGGHVDEGEDFLAGAYRELAEETGLRYDSGLELFGEFTVHHDHTGTDDRVQLFVMGVPLTDADVECHEGRRIVFVDPDRVPQLDLTASATLVLPRLLGSEHYRRIRSTLESTSGAGRNA